MIKRVIKRFQKFQNYHNFSLVFYLYLFHRSPDKTRDNRSESKSRRRDRTPSKRHDKNRSKSPSRPVIKPVVKLQSPENSSSSEDEEIVKKMTEKRAEQDLDAFLPLDENKEQREKELTLLRALKSGLAAKAKQTLEKKRTEEINTAEATRDRRNENREKAIQIQSAEISQSNSEHSDKSRLMIKPFKIDNHVLVKAEREKEGETNNNDNRRSTSRTRESLMAAVDSILWSSKECKSESKRKSRSYSRSSNR